HPVVLGLLPGAALFVLWRGWPLLRTRWAALAVGLFVVVNLNLLAYNLSTGFGSVDYGLEVAASRAYSREEVLTPATYSTRMTRLLLGLARHLGGAVDQRRGGTDSFADDLGLWPISLLAVAGVLWQWRRGNPLPLLLLNSTALLLPLFNGRFEPVQVG